MQTRVRPHGGTPLDPPRDRRFAPCPCRAHCVGPWTNRSVNSLLVAYPSRWQNLVVQITPGSSLHDTNQPDLNPSPLQKELSTWYFGAEGRDSNPDPHFGRVADPAQCDSSQSPQCGSVPVSITFATYVLVVGPFTIRPTRAPVQALACRSARRLDRGPDSPGPPLQRRSHEAPFISLSSSTPTMSTSWAGERVDPRLKAVRYASTARRVRHSVNALWHWAVEPRAV
jgi:hypothetical protein